MPRNSVLPFFTNYLLTYFLAYSLTNLLTYLLACLHTYLLTYFFFLFLDGADWFVRDRCVKAEGEIFGKYIVALRILCSTAKKELIKLAKLNKS